MEIEQKLSNAEILERISNTDNYMRVDFGITKYLSMVSWFF